MRHNSLIHFSRNKPINYIGTMPIEFQYLYLSNDNERTLEYANESHNHDVYKKYAFTE